MNQAIADKLSKLFDKNEKYGDAVENLQASLSNIRHVTDSLNVAMGAHAAEMEEIVMNVRDLTASAKAFTKDLQEISGERKDDIKVALEQVPFRRRTPRRDPLAKIQSGKGAIGTLVGDDKTGPGREVEAVTSIKDTASTSAKKVLSRFTMINTYWDFRYRYDTRDDDGKADVSIRFESRSAGKFYAFGATNIGDTSGGREAPGLRAEQPDHRGHGPRPGLPGLCRRHSFGGRRRPELPAAAGPAETGPPFRGHGRGLRLQPRSRCCAGRPPHDGAILDVGGHVAITKWFWLGARAEDVLARGPRSWPIRTSSSGTRISPTFSDSPASRDVNRRVFLASDEFLWRPERWSFFKL